MRALLALGAVCCLATAWMLANREGLIVACAGLTALSLLILRAVVPGGPPAVSPPRRRPARDLARAFPGYRRIHSALGWADVSARHYDLSTRPLLQRLLTARLADRYGLDPARSPERARELLGEELWPLLDPSRPASSDSDAPGVDMVTLARIADRLETL
ncbi:hypothetical protein [Actinoallomurus acaciae]|uniref:Uncharacterized protein n=1 Tax=Actinoallomurus acaciae TaxID=502577 RepID=A0ABV5YBQ3_9ACTN